MAVMANLLKAFTIYEDDGRVDPLLIASRLVIA